MKIARLNKTGIETFAGWIDAANRGGTSDASALLYNPNMVEPLSQDLEIDARKFTCRFDAAKYLHDCFIQTEISNIENDKGMWAWLSLFYLDSVCPLKTDGTRKPGALARHIPEPGNFQLYYRHLLAGPYLIYRAYRDDPTLAMVLLCQPLDSPGDVVEQLASRQELVTNRGIIGLATKLYVDQETKRLKRGAGGKDKGAARRLSDVVEQFDLTWDLYASTPDELALVLPKEFERFLK